MRQYDGGIVNRVLGTSLMMLLAAWALHAAVQLIASVWVSAAIIAVVVVIVLIARQLGRRRW